MADLNPNITGTPIPTPATIVGETGASPGPSVDAPEVHTPTPMADTPTTDSPNPGASQ